MGVLAATWLIASLFFSAGMSLILGLTRRLERQRRYEELKQMLEAVHNGAADPDAGYREAA